MAPVARRLTRYRPRILMYHGLTQDTDVWEWTQVHVDDFRDQMRYLRSAFTPISLAQLVDSLETGDFPPLAVAVTFDDGFKSNYELALPILREFGVPATVFVTSGFVSDTDAEPGCLWPDLMTMILLSIPENELDLTRFDAGKFTFSTRTERYAARNRLTEYLKAIADDRKNEIVDWLRETYGRHIAYEKFPHLRPMNLDELRRLADDDLISIGAHTRTHPILGRLDDDRLFDEIIGGRDDLERITGREVRHFAYPNGRLRDINRAIYDMTATHFDSAVTTEVGLSRPGTNKYLLPRIGVGRSLALPEFRMHMAGIYHMFRSPAANAIPRQGEID